MKRFFQKYIYWLLITVVLAAMVLLGLPEAEDVPFRFQLQAGDQTVRIAPFWAEDDSYYVFLPAYARMEQLTAEVPYGHRISLGGTPLTGDTDCGGFAPETQYDLVIDDHYVAKLQFLRSANVASLHIQTATGTMTNIYLDKEYEEPASLVLYSPEGRVDHLDINCKLKGRGNASWNYEKKPFSLTLSAAGELLDMGSGVNWVLLANAADASNLHNKLAFDLAEHLGLPGTPDCEYVDLYLNGEYWGLYLLASRVEAGSTRLDIDTAGGDFLCKVDLAERWQTLRNPMQTQSGCTVELSEPKFPTAEEYSRIEALVNELDALILSGTDLGLAPNFDLDSWVRRYLIDEVSANIDADLASSYFYYSGGAFHAGPVWDYDMTFGNSYRNARPDAFVAKNGEKSRALYSVFNGALYENPSFYSAVTQTYQAELLPWAERMLDTGIEQLAGSIAASAKMNGLRWSVMYRSLDERDDIIGSTPESTKAYLRERVEFLNSAWIDGTEYCTVQVEPGPGEPYCSFTVVKGQQLDAAYPDMHDKPWVIYKTGQAFDPDSPITEDLILRAKAAPRQEAVETQPKTEIATREIVTVLSILILLGMFGGVLAVSVRHRRKERRKVNAKSGTNLSS